MTAQGAFLGFGEHSDIGVYLSIKSLIFNNIITEGKGAEGTDRSMSAGRGQKAGPVSGKAGKLALVRPGRGREMKDG